MRNLSAALLFVVVLGCASAALADGVAIHERSVEWRIVEPCDVLVNEGEVTLGWNDCDGAWALTSFEYENYPHPISVLFYTGNPDFSTMDEHVYWSFFCNRCCTTKRPDVYCADCNPCAWYCYRTNVSWCGETVCVMAYLPTCMALDIVDVY